MKTKDMATFEIVMELEGGSLLLEDHEDLERVKDVCRMFASSQGFYGRLLADIEWQEDMIEYPVMI